MNKEIGLYKCVCDEIETKSEMKMKSKKKQRHIAITEVESNLRRVFEVLLAAFFLSSSSSSF